MSRKRIQNARTPRPATPVTLAGVLAALERHAPTTETTPDPLAVSGTTEAYAS